MSMGAAIFIHCGRHRWPVPSAACIVAILMSHCVVSFASVMSGLRFRCVPSTVATGLHIEIHRYEVQWADARGLRAVRWRCAFHVSELFMSNAALEACVPEISALIFSIGLHQTFLRWVFGCFFRCSRCSASWCFSIAASGLLVRSCVWACMCRHRFGSAPVPAGVPR